MQTVPSHDAAHAAAVGGHDVIAAAAARRARPAARSTVHRDPVVTLGGRVVGYTVTVTVEQGHASVHRAREHHRLGAPAGPTDAVHAEYMALDLPNLVADRYVFLPATPAMLDGFVPTPVVSGRLVLELPAGYERSPDAGPRAAALRALGMQLSLLDYRGSPLQDALLPHLAFVVVEPTAADTSLAHLVHTAHGSNVRVLAADVRDPAVQDECRAAGVDGLRGGHGARVEAAQAPAAQSPARVLRAGELQCLALMHLLSQPEVNFSEISQVVDTDPVLTLRVLHLVNSGAFALSHEVDTVHQGVVLLGARELTTLVSALLVESRPDAMDSLWFILARALTCETLAEDSAAYTVGMLSALAGQLGVSAEVILEKVGVSAVVADAVRVEAGPLGLVLAAVRAHEGKDPGGVLVAGMLPAEVSSAYVRCLADALETARTVTRGSDF